MTQVAKSSKSKADEAQDDQTVEDVTAESEPDAPDPVADEAAAPEDAVAEEEIEDAEIVEDDAPVEEPDAEPVDETPQESPQETQPQPAQQEAQRSGGFLPLLIGGLLAGGIGYGAATWYEGQNAAPDLSSQVDAQGAEISDLRSTVANLPAVPDLAPLEDRIAALESSLADRVDQIQSSLDDRLAEIDARLTDLEKRPSGDGTLSDTALAAYERELAQLREELDTQRQDVAAMAEQAQADLDAARAEAAAQEEEALAAARAAAARAALNRVAVAMESGEPFADLLPDLEAEVGDIPAALRDAAQNGVTSQAMLKDEFPDVARAALAAARAEGVSGESGGLGAFLRQQFDVRSTTPREGSDPDAVLSRVGAAVDEGRLSDALAEVASLPEVARAEMTEWTAKVQERADALDAITSLSQTLNEN